MTPLVVVGLRSVDDHGMLADAAQWVSMVGGKARVLVFLNSKKPCAMNLEVAVATPPYDTLLQKLQEQCIVQLVASDTEVHEALDQIAPQMRKVLILLDHGSKQSIGVNDQFVFKLQDLLGKMCDSSLVVLQCCEGPSHFDTAKLWNKLHPDRSHTFLIDRTGHTLMNNLTGYVHGGLMTLAVTQQMELYPGTQPWKNSIVEASCFVVEGCRECSVELTPCTWRSVTDPSKNRYTVSCAFEPKLKASTDQLPDLATELNHWLDIDVTEQLNAEELWEVGGGDRLLPIARRALANGQDIKGGWVERIAFDEQASAVFLAFGEEEWQSIKSRARSTNAQNAIKTEGVWPETGCMMQ